jgi:predicted  nucleic acid-binding Zn-ribbon protein
MEAKTKTTEKSELPVEEKLRALFRLQKVNSEIDKIRTLRGELPLEVQDLEDEIAGLQTRVDKYQEEVKGLESAVGTKKNEIGEAQSLIDKYKEQQSNVRNNREYESLSKEIEYQTLEIELCEKRIKEYTGQVKDKNTIIDESKKTLDERTNDLNDKKSELDEIIKDTEKEEDLLMNKRKDYESIIEERLLTAYKKIRKNARNGLAVVTVERDACGGCFNKIPPQRQLDIRSRKKIIVCEYCGRILVDTDMSTEDDKSGKS